jgi:hypothetical protein
MLNIADMKLHMLSHQDPMSCGEEVQVDGGNGRRNWLSHAYGVTRIQTNGDEKKKITKIIQYLSTPAIIGRKGLDWQGWMFAGRKN